MSVEPRRRSRYRAAGLCATTAAVLALTAPLGPLTSPATAGPAPLDAPRDRPDRPREDPGGAGKSGPGRDTAPPDPVWQGPLTGPPRHPDEPPRHAPRTPDAPGPTDQDGRPPAEEAPGRAPTAPEPERAPAAPPRSVGELLGELRALYRDASSATDDYNAAEEALREHRATADRLGRRLGHVRAELAAARRAAGRLAREQYQGGSPGLAPYLRLLLADGDPQEVFHRGHLVGEAAKSQAGVVRRVAAAEQRLERAAERARGALARRQELAEEEAERRDAVRERLDEIAGLLASVSDAQLAAVRELERSQTATAQRALLEDGKVGGTPAAPTTPTAAGAEAVRSALAQVGKPYRWGAEGPESFDCSGLTSWAWARADRAVPRTSQEQWRRLPRVDLADLRPGDLVVYFPEATHVALYLGDGQVVQAPRPGAAVKVSPLAANPLLGAVRPDADGRPLPAYTPPPLPPGAREGADTGYASAQAPPTPTQAPPQAPTRGAGADDPSGAAPDAATPGVSR
ncbi:NlpC/P60 family protein [Streptomyces chumphonensis]|uniref:NlpC/P60 family protein n=2 Tax=Streptomyces chumphonensis TaxID=1214925 RepID=UPI00296438FE|nr:NlpC/P60 family protein [Streptomyces chumphonensis]